MAYTFDELTTKRVAELREIAKDIDHEAVHGYSTMHKEQLVRGLCTALGIEAHEHHHVIGIDKSGVKRRIRELKAQRDAALEAHDHAQLQVVRRQIHRLKHKLRDATI
jgi:DNA-binding IclR family transcriptional regulator